MTQPEPAQQPQHPQQQPQNPFAGVEAAQTPPQPPATMPAAPQWAQQGWQHAQQQAQQVATPAPPNGVSYADQLAEEAQPIEPPPGAELLGDPRKLRYGARAQLMKTVKPLYQQFQDLQPNANGEVPLDANDVGGNLDRVVAVYELAEQVQEALAQIAVDADAFDAWCTDNDIPELMAVFQYAVQGLAMGKSSPSANSSTASAQPSAPTSPPNTG